MIYLIHLTKGLARSNGTRAEHYLGYCSENGLQERLEMHRKGRGAKMLKVAVERGSDLILVRTWPNGGQALERYLKNNSHLGEHCPICKSSKLRNRRLARRRAAAALNHQLTLPFGKQRRGSGTVWLLPSSNIQISPSGVYRVGLLQEPTTRSGAKVSGPTHGGPASDATAPPASERTTSSAGTEPPSGSAT